MTESARSEGIRQLGESTFWINECYAHADAHEHVSVYIVKRDNKHVMIDSGSYYHRKSIKTKIEDVSGNEGISSLILSHSDYPHSGNVKSVQEKYGKLTLIASSGAPEVQGLDDAIKCTIGESMVIDGLKFSFVDPPLADRSHTTWIFNHDTGILFTADGFGNHHDLGQCNYISPEFDTGIPREAIYKFHYESLSWLKYVDARVIGDALQTIIDDLDPSFIAPVHGNPIASSDIPTYMNKLIESVDRIESEYTVGSAF
jgi:Uncharacterized flavoproteins